MSSRFSLHIIGPETEGVAEIEIEDEIIEDDKEDKEWRVPMSTSYINKSKQDVDYMDYKAYALLSVFSKRKSEEVCDLLGLDYSEIEEHRYIYQDYINENIEMFEDLSNWKKRNIQKQINNLVRSGNKVISANYTESGNLYYKIIPYISKEGGLSKSGTYVTIESDVLKYLIHTSNSNVIKTYCVFKWLLWNDKKKSYTEKRIDRQWICEQIGLSSSSKNNLEVVGNILKSLIEKKLIKRRKESITEFGVNKTVYFYSICSYNEWKEHYNKL